MEPILAARLAALAAAFVAATGRSRATVAQSAAGDWRFFDGVAAGKSFRVRTYDRAVAWFAANWPAGLDWPEWIERPPVRSCEPEAVHG